MYNPSLISFVTYKNNYVNPTSSYWFQKGFSKEECEKIITLGNSQVLEPAQMSVSNNNGGTYNETLRKSEICWLEYNKDTDWIYSRINEMVRIANDKIWNFDIYGFTEPLQFLKYEEDDHMSYHMDFGPNNLRFRKISVVIFLSEEDDYTGGDLMIHSFAGEEGSIVKKEIGTVILFPSYLLHKVTPITKGRRYTLVLWVSGPPFR